MKQLTFSVIIGILALIAISSCSNITKKTKKGIIDFESAIDANKYSIHKLSDYASSVRYVPLETRDDVLVGQIQAYISHYHNKQFYIVSSGRIFKFDSSGKFMTNISGKGQGPEEYIGIEDLDISPETEHLYILNETQALLEYTLDGSFIRRLPLKTDTYENQFPTDFRVVTQNLYAFGLSAFSDANYMLAFSDIDYQNILPVKYTETQIGIGRVYFETLKRFAGEIQYHNTVYMDTIYTVNQNKTLSPVYIFQLGKYEYQKEKNNRSSSISFRDYLDTGSYVFMNWQFNDNAHEKFEYTYGIGGVSRTATNSNVYSIYDKRDGNLYLLKQPVPTVLGLQNDIDNGPVFWPDIISSDGKEAIMFYDAYKLTEDYKELKNPSQELKAIVENLKEDDNPVLVIVKLKQ